MSCHKLLLLVAVLFSSIAGIEAKLQSLRRHHRHRHPWRHHRRHLTFDDFLRERATRQHRRHHRRASLASAAVTQRFSTDGDSPHGKDDLLNHPEVPEVVNGVETYRIHPLVGRALSRMEPEVLDLSAAKDLADKDQEKLGAVSSEAAGHMSEGVVLKRNIVKAQAAERFMDEKVKKLGREEARIEKNKEKMQRTLNGVMDPKIKAMENRVAAKKKAADKRREEVNTWQAKREEYRTHALEQLQARKDSAAQLKNADQELADAQKEESVARQRYETQKRLASEGVQQFRYVETRYKGATSQLKEVEPEIAKEEKGLNKMKEVQKLETKRVDQAADQQKQQLHRVEDGVEKEREGKDKELLFLHKRYEDWQHGEKERAAVVAQRKEAYRQASESYKEKHSEVYHKAETSAASRANKDADWGWDDWAWSGGNSADPQDEEVHLADDSK